MNICKMQAFVCLRYFLVLLSSSHAYAEEILQVTVQGNYFVLATQATIKYGANNSFNQKILQPGTYSCNDGFFGDPIRNIFKACYVVKNPDGMVKITDQFGIFEIKNTSIVFYGANGSFFQKSLATGKYQCDDKLFGDPILGTVKACYLKGLETAQVSQAKLTSQYGSFNLAKSTVVSYGANGVFFKKNLPAGTYSCNDQLFGDPLFGVVKACYATDVPVASASLNKVLLETSYPECDD